MRFAEVITALMAGGGNAVRRPWMSPGTFLRYSELFNVFEFHGTGGVVIKMEDLSLSPGDLFADDWEVVILDPQTGEVAE